MASYDALALRAQRATLVCVLAPLILVAIDILIAPSHTPTSVGLLAIALVLLFFVPGIRRGRVKNFAWLSYVSLLYFMQSVVVLFASHHWLNALHLLFAVSLFISALLSVRYTARAQRASAP